MNLLETLYKPIMIQYIFQLLPCLFNTQTLSLSLVTPNRNAHWLWQISQPEPSAPGPGARQDLTCFAGLYDAGESIAVPIHNPYLTVPRAAI